MIICYSAYLIYEKRNIYISFIYYNSLYITVLKIFVNNIL